MRYLTIEQARARGFRVDTLCYPHVAYKGPRFNPTEHRYVFTSLEARLYAACKAALNHGRFESNREDNLRRELRAAVADAEEG